jgi:beta-lactam-binding protein with PASTA domain
VRDYVGWPANEARADLQSKSCRRPHRCAHRASRAKRVVDQMPRNAEVKAGATVTLVVSDGSLVRVPSVTRLLLPRAEQTLRERDLTVQPQRRESDAPTGTVLQQEPTPDTEVARGSAVRVLVAVARPTPPAPPAPCCRPPSRRRQRLRHRRPPRTATRC